MSLLSKHMSPITEIDSCARRDGGMTGRDETIGTHTIAVIGTAHIGRVTGGGSTVLEEVIAMVGVTQITVAMVTVLEEVIAMVGVTQITVAMATMLKEVIAMVGVTHITVAMAKTRSTHSGRGTRANANKVAFAQSSQVTHRWDRHSMRERQSSDHGRKLARRRREH